MSFDLDLEIGKELEKKVCNVINNTYPLAFVIEGKCKAYDIFIPEIGKGVEVKSDQMSQYTGNIVIETEMYGVPSGIMTTEASWWIFFTGEKYIIITPEKIKEILKFEKCVTFVGYGDVEMKKAYLVKQEKIEKNALRVWTLYNFTNFL